MKTIHFLILALVSGTLFAQNKNYATHLAVDEAQQLVSINTNRIVKE